MGDIPNVEKNRLVIEGPTGNDLKVDSNGSLQARLFDASAALIGQKAMAASLPVVISSDQSAVPVTISSTADENFCISEPITPSAASETDVILVKNPSGSGKKLYLDVFEVLGLAVDFSSIIRIYSNPTITANGTAITVKNGNVGSGITSVMNAYKFPTISARGSLLYTGSFLKAVTASWFIEFAGRLLWNANNNLLITFEHSATNRDAVISAIWREK